MIVAVLVVLVFTGCDVAFGSEYEVTIVNQTTGSFNYFDVLNITDAGQDTWGKNYVSNSTYIKENSTRKITVSPISTPDNVDVRVQLTLLPVSSTVVRKLYGNGLDLNKTIYIKDSGITN